jgi:hypothetical protein
MPDLLKMKTMWEVWGKYIKTVKIIVKKLLFKSNQEVSYTEKCSNETLYGV